MSNIIDYPEALVEAPAQCGVLLLALYLELCGEDPSLAVDVFAGRAAIGDGVAPKVSAADAAGDADLQGLLASVWLTKYIVDCFAGLLAGVLLHADGPVSRTAVPILGRSIFEASTRARYYQQRPEAALRDLKSTPAQWIKQYDCFRSASWTAARDIRQRVMFEWAAPFLGQTETFKEMLREVVGDVRFEREYSLRYGFPSAIAHAQVHLMLSASDHPDKYPYYVPDTRFELALVCDTIFQHVKATAATYGCDTTADENARIASVFAKSARAFFGNDEIVDFVWPHGP